MARVEGRLIRHRAAVCIRASVRTAAGTERRHRSQGSEDPNSETSRVAWSVASPARSAEDRPRAGSPPRPDHRRGDGERDRIRQVPSHHLADPGAVDEATCRGRGAAGPRGTCRIEREAVGRGRASAARSRWSRRLPGRQHCDHRIARQEPHREEDEREHEERRQKRVKRPLEEELRHRGPVREAGPPASAIRS